MGLKIRKEVGENKFFLVISDLVISDEKCFY